jgi:hypothetical protein
MRAGHAKDWKGVGAEYPDESRTEPKVDLGSNPNDLLIITDEFLSIIF